MTPAEEERWRRTIALLVDLAEDTGVVVPEKLRDVLRCPIVIPFSTVCYVGMEHQLSCRPRKGMTMVYRSDPPEKILHVEQRSNPGPWSQEHWRIRYASEGYGHAYFTGAVWLDKS